MAENSAPVKSNQNVDLSFSHISLKIQMPLNMKVVSFDKIHNFCIERI
jgi:hypothetical protein